MRKTHTALRFYKPPQSLFFWAARLLTKQKLDLSSCPQFWAPQNKHTHLFGSLCCHSPQQPENKNTSIEGTRQVLCVATLAAARRSPHCSRWRMGAAPRATLGDARARAACCRRVKREHARTHTLMSAGCVGAFFLEGRVTCICVVSAST